MDLALGSTPFDSLPTLATLMTRARARRRSGSALEGFAPRLVQLRQARGLTQEEFGTLVGLSNRMIACYERDDAEPPGRSSRRSRRLLRSDWQTREDARRAVFRYIETWYSPKRRHSTLGYLSPAAYEVQLLEAA